MTSSARAGVRRQTEKRSSSGSSRSLIWGTPSEGSIVVQFVKPADGEFIDALDLGRNYREVYCPKFKHVDDGTWTAGPFEGRPRSEIPTGYRSVITLDWAEFEAEDGTAYIGETGEDYIEMHDGTVLNLVPDILDATSVVEPVKWKGWLKDDAGNLRPSWRTMVDVVVHQWNDAKPDAAGPDEGDRILLKLYDSDWANEIAPRLEDAANLGADIYARLWTIEFTPKSGKAKRSVRAAAGRSQVPVLDVEPMDVSEAIEAERQRFVNLAVAVYKDAAEDKGQADAPDFVPETIAFSKMSPQRLKAMLSKAEVEYGAKATHAELVALAKEHLS